MAGIRTGIARMILLGLAIIVVLPDREAWSYDYGIIPTGASVTDAALATKYSSYKSYYFTNDCATNQLRVRRARVGVTGESETVSEGQAYGMLMLAYLENDAAGPVSMQYLLNFVNNHINSGLGLMNWKVTCTGNTSDGNGPATDGDLDMALALLQAEKRWPGYGFGNRAATFIDNILLYEADGCGLRPGNWGGCYSGRTNPSYMAMSYFTTFKCARNDSAWDDVKAGCYNQNTYWLKNYKLPPDWIYASTGALCTDGSCPDQYYYDACRVPWRFSLDYLWNGNSMAQSMCTKIVNNFKSTDPAPSTMLDFYTASTGARGGVNHNAAFVGPAACGAMVDSAHQTWLDAAYSNVKSMAMSEYFKDSMQILSLMVMTGVFTDPCSSGPTVTPTHTLSPTVTPTNACGLVTCTPTVTLTRTLTRTPTATLTPPPSSRLNLQVRSSNGSDPCSTNSSRFRVRITNWETGPINLNTLTARMWVNQSDSIGINGCWGGIVYDASGVSQGNASCSAAFVSSTACTAATDRKSSGVVEITFMTSIEIPANGGYFSLDSDIEIYRGTWTTPFDLDCDDYSKVGISQTFHEDAYFTLYQGANLVCEYTSATTVDTETGIPPCGVSSCGGSGGATSTWTVTPTLTSSRTLTGTPTVTRTATPTRTMTVSPSATASPTPTSTVTRTASATPSHTGTPTLPPGVTPSDTPTFSPTLTASSTPSPSKTSTATVSSTRTVTPSVSPSFTWTPVLSATPTRTLGETPTSTVTSSPTFGGQKGSVSEIYPNPSWKGEPVTLDVAGPGLIFLEWSVYSTAFRKIRRETAIINRQGKIHWDLRDEKGVLVSNGIYYMAFCFDETRNGSSDSSLVRKVMVLR